jgi:outer membrane murein-binding lipoprotein Lpp
MANILKTLELTQEEYNNLEVKDNDTMYITESGIYIGSTLMTDRIKLLNEINKIQQEVDTIDEGVDNLKENIVSSVNGQTGDIIIDIPDTSSFATKTELSNEVQTLNDKIDNLDIESDVTSVNGQTGDVTIDIPDTSSFTTKTELSTEVQKLTNKINEVDNKECDVTSVNGQTGDVTIDIPDTSSFATKTELSTEVQTLNTKIDNLPTGGGSVKAGQNITITNTDTINAEGYRYSSNNFIINDVTNNKSSSQYTFVQGYNNTVNTNSNNSTTAGSNGIVSHSNSFLFGDGLKSVNTNCTVLGRYNSPQDNWNAVLWVGMGTSDADRKNVMIIQDNAVHYRGELKEGSGWMGDIAEYFEWYDGNILDEDRVGYMVQLKDGKIEYATDIDNCIGVVSDTCILTAGSCSMGWHGMYLKDKFGRDILEEVNGEMLPIKNPNYDESLVYISRDKRKEWCKVGIIGQVIVRQDGTLESGSYVNCVNGIATKSTEKTSYRVVKVIDDTVAIILIK